VADGSSARGQAQHTARQYGIGLVVATFFFVSVLLHELAHALVAVRVGIRVLSIRLFIFGGIAEMSGQPQSGRQEFLIALAGPAANTALAFLFGVAGAASTLAGAPTIAGVTGYLAFSNVLLVVFNLIPGFPLDGGRILRAVLWDHWNDMTRATKVVSRFGNAFALFLIVLGGLMLFVSDRFILAIWLVFIGLVMKQSAVGSYQAVALKQALTGVQIRQIMTVNPVTVDWLMSVEELVQDFIYRHQFTSFPVFNRDDFVGMVSLEGVKQVPKELWTFKQVRDVMTPAEHVPSLHPGEDATDVLARMVTEDRGLMPVIEGGRLVGVVSRRDILNLFKIKSDLGLT